MAKRASKRIGLRDLQSLPPNSEIWDAAVAGFGARRRTGPAVAFVLMYRNAEGRQRWLTIGRLGSPWTADMARAEAVRILGEVAKGGDPAADKQARRKAATVSELLDLYLADAQAGHVLGRGGLPKKPGTIAIDRGMIEGHIRPVLGPRTVAGLTRRDVEQFMRAVADGKTASTRKTRPRGLSRVRGGRGAATRVMGLLGAILTYSVTRGIRADNPARGVRRYADGRRSRRLSDDEYAALGKGLKAAEGSVSAPAIACLRFLALTGWRSNEALSLKWRDVDLIRRTARLADTKTGASMRPLSNAACDVLHGLTRLGDSELVFPASRPGVVMSGFKKFARRVIAMSGLPADITPHTLRHSFASTANDLGFSDATIAMLIGHKGRATTTSLYVHGADAVLLQAADQVANRIAKLMGETLTGGQVVELRRV